MKNFLTFMLYFVTIIAGIDFERFDYSHELITIRYDDLSSDSLIVDRKDLKNKDKIWKAIEQILNERNVYSIKGE